MVDIREYNYLEDIKPIKTEPNSHKIFKIISNPKS